jgi:hypothetical protein
MVVLHGATASGACGSYEQRGDPRRDLRAVVYAEQASFGRKA